MDQKAKIESFRRAWKSYNHADRVRMLRQLVDAVANGDPYPNERLWGFVLAAADRLEEIDIEPVGYDKTVEHYREVCRTLNQKINDRNIRFKSLVEDIQDLPVPDYQSKQIIIRHLEEMLNFSIIQHDEESEAGNGRHQ